MPCPVVSNWIKFLNCSLVLKLVSFRFVNRLQLRRLKPRWNFSLLKLVKLMMCWCFYCLHSLTGTFSVENCLDVAVLLGLLMFCNELQLKKMNQMGWALAGKDSSSTKMLHLMMRKSKVKPLFLHVDLLHMQACCFRDFKFVACGLHSCQSCKL